MTEPRPWSRRGKAVAIGLIAAGVALFVVANVQLFHLAMTSQPACVPHIKDVGSGPPGALYAPAKSSC